MRPLWPYLPWAVLLAALFAPLAIAAASPLLAWRDPVYILGGFAGIIGLGLLLAQPLLAGGHLGGLTRSRSRRLHGWVGAGLVLAVGVHVIALWITSPPDVVDVLLFRSPTPFAVWGALAMWAVFLAALFAYLRRRLRIRLSLWRAGHMALAAVTVVGTVVHAVQIEGTMGPMSKYALCALVIVAGAKVMFDTLKGPARRS